MSEKAIGGEGYLANRGLIPPSKSEIGPIRKTAETLTTFSP